MTKEEYKLIIDEILSTYSGPSRGAIKDCFRTYEEYVLATANKTKNDEGDVFNDELYNSAVMYVKEMGKCSISLLQRKFLIGFAAAGRMIDRMENEGIISSNNVDGYRAVIKNT